MSKRSRYLHKGPYKTARKFGQLIGYDIDIQKISASQLSVSSIAEVPKEFSVLPTAQEAMYKLIRDFEFETVLDIGSGAGAHVELLIKHGKKVTAIDFGSSVYFRKKDDHKYNVSIGDFLEFSEQKSYDCIWASHVLEHQPNPGVFLSKCFRLLRDGGILAVTVPPLKHNIVGGHLSLWNAGLLLYQLAFNGFDCREASVRTTGYNVSVLLRKKARESVDLDYDAGDVDRLNRFLPGFCQEGFDGRIDVWNW